MNKVYIEHGNREYHDLFKVLGFAITNDPEEAQLICFTGGADVTPGMYGATHHAMTYNDSRRDNRERALFEHFFSKKVPMVGICRGGQFLNVMSGGEMYQHVTKHTVSHDLTDVETGEVIYVSSTHHQMMKPGKDAQIVATSSQGGTREWFDCHVAKNDISKMDYEVLYYPTTNCLCFQPHPEFDSVVYLGMRTYFATLIDRFLKV